MNLSAEDLDRGQTGRYRLPPPVRRIVAGRGRIDDSSGLAAPQAQASGR